MGSPEVVVVLDAGVCGGALSFDPQAAALVIASAAVTVVNTLVIVS
jgi:hypothetical protein